MNSPNHLQQIETSPLYRAGVVAVAILAIRPMTILQGVAERWVEAFEDERRRRVRRLIPQTRQTIEAE